MCLFFRSSVAFSPNAVKGSSLPRSVGHQGCPTFPLCQNSPSVKFMVMVGLTHGQKPTGFRRYLHPPEFRLKPSLGVFPWDLWYESRYLVSRNWSPWATLGENRMILRSLVLMHHQRVTDRLKHRLWLPRSAIFNALTSMHIASLIGL